MEKQTNIHDKAFHNFANIAKNNGILRSPYVTPPCRPQYVKEKKKLVGLCVERKKLCGKEKKNNPVQLYVKRITQFNCMSRRITRFNCMSRRITQFN
jgi:hypothetical protein